MASKQFGLFLSNTAIIDENLMFSLSFKLRRGQTVLSAGFSHVRVDLYNVDGRIYFGEMTFTNGSGLDPIVPQEYDRMLGDLWRIDTSKRY